jgi:hypothetical protein
MKHSVCGYGSESAAILPDPEPHPRLIYPVQTGQNRSENVDKIEFEFSIFSKQQFLCNKIRIRMRIMQGKFNPDPDRQQ